MKSLVACHKDRQSSRSRGRLPVKETRLHISVVIPVYNRAQLARRAIASVLSQSYRDFELIVVDDGSVEDIRGVVDSFADPRIIYTKQENKGASAARNHGIELARGAHVSFLDSDDIYLPHHLKDALAALRQSKKTAFYTPVIAARAEGVQVVKPPRSLGQDENMAIYLMCDRGFVQTSGLVVPIGIAREVRYREDAGYGDDTDFAIRLQLAGCRFIMAEKPGVIWSDGASVLRLSAGGATKGGLVWLEDLKERIPRRAYDGYRGWHLAKALFWRQPVAAMRLYLRALASDAFGMRLAMIVLCQIVFPAPLYRLLANAVIRVQSVELQSTGNKRLPI
jgi:glycosyltransferase involved in cell wall biosynthesis